MDPRRSPAERRARVAATFSELTLGPGRRQPSQPRPSPRPRQFTPTSADPGRPPEGYLRPFQERKIAAMMSRHSWVTAFIGRVLRQGHSTDPD